MTPLDHAVRDITRALDSLRIAYAIIGGIANAVWGEPRATIDVDVTVAVDDDDLPATVPAIAQNFRVPVSDPLAFVQQTRVLPLDTDDGVRIDVIFALLPFELDAIRRAKEVTIADRTVHVVTPEDLILMKIISERPRDVADAKRSCGAGSETWTWPTSNHASGNWPRPSRATPSSIAGANGLGGDGSQVKIASYTMPLPSGPTGTRKIS